MDLYGSPDDLSFSESSFPILLLKNRSYMRHLPISALYSNVFCLGLLANAIRKRLLVDNEMVSPRIEIRAYKPIYDCLSDECLAERASLCGIFSVLSVLKLCQWLGKLYYNPFRLKDYV